MGGGEPGGVPQTSGLQRPGALPCGLAGQAVMHVSRRMKSDAPVPMLMIIEIHELDDELPGGLQGAEPFREHRRVLQRPVPLLRKTGCRWKRYGLE